MSCVTDAPNCPNWAIPLSVAGALSHCTSDLEHHGIVAYSVLKERSRDKMLARWLATIVLVCNATCNISYTAAQRPTQAIFNQRDPKMQQAIYGHIWWSTGGRLTVRLSFRDRRTVHPAPPALLPTVCRRERWAHSKWRTAILSLWTRLSTRTFPAFNSRLRVTHRDRISTPDASRTSVYTGWHWRHFKNNKRPSCWRYT